MPIRLSELIVSDIGEKSIVEFVKARSRNSPKTAKGAKKEQLLFVVRAERAFGRVARKVRAENRKLGLQPVVWPNGKRVVAK
jgi:hypothetical protein